MLNVCAIRDSSAVLLGSWSTVERQSLWSSTCGPACEHACMWLTAVPSSTCELQLLCNLRGLFEGRRLCRRGCAAAGSAEHAHCMCCLVT